MDSSNQGSTVSFNPGDFLIKEKTACDTLYIIKEGQLEVYKTGPAGEKIPIAMISSGQYVGETALLMGLQHQSNVVCLTPVKAVKISKSSIEAQLKTVPAWLLSMTKGLITRLHHANDLLKRNGWVDESLAGRVKTVESKFKKEA